MNTDNHLEIGDVLSVPKGVFNHMGVVVPGGVLQIRPGRTEEVVSPIQFAAGRPVKVHKTGVSPIVIMARTQRILTAPKSYDPLFRNCEHTVNEVVTGRATSPQLGTALAILAVGTLLFFGLKKSA